MKFIRTMMHGGFLVGALIGAFGKAHAEQAASIDYGFVERNASIPTSFIMLVKMRWFTGQQVPMTAQHFLTYRSEASSTADGTYWIKRVPVPILMVRDASDAVVAAFEPYMLLSSATSQGSLVPSIDYKLLSDDKPVSLENHYFVNNQQPLVGVVTDWLASRELR